MKKWLLPIFLIICLIRPIQAQEKWNINFDMTLKEIDKKYYFVVDGKTNLPDSSQFTVVLSYIYSLKRRDGEEQISCEGYLDDKTLEAEGGKFYATLGGYKRKPFSIPYRCTVKFDPKNQFEVVKDAVKDAGEFEKSVDLRLGSITDFGNELAIVRQEVKDDFAKIDAIFCEIKNADTPDRAVLEKKIEELAERNNQRIGNWLMSLETQGKIYIGGLCDRLKELLEAKKKYDATKVGELEGAFTNLYNDEIYALGFDTPIAMDKVSDCLKKLKGALATSSESAFNSAIFELANILPERHLKLLTGLSEAFHNADRQGIKATFAKLEDEINNRR